MPWHYWIVSSDSNLIMFHPSQQPREPTQLACLSLAKFSHTTTSIGHNGPLNWSHIIGNGDIVGQIESHSASGLTPARVLLKVFRDYELLVRTWGPWASLKTTLTETVLSFRKKSILRIIHERPQTLLCQGRTVRWSRLLPWSWSCPVLLWNIRRMVYACVLKFNPSDKEYLSVIILIESRFVDSRSNFRRITTTTQPWLSWATSSAPFQNPTLDRCHPLADLHLQNGELGQLILHPLLQRCSLVPQVQPVYQLWTMCSFRRGRLPQLIHLRWHLLWVSSPNWYRPGTSPANCWLALIGSFLRPTSSSTTHTLTELVPTSNSQGPNPNNINLTRSQLQSNIPEQSNAVPSSRPPTACHDTETLDQLLPPKRDLPFTKPATKKPRTSGKQTNNASKSSEPGMTFYPVIEVQVVVRSLAS